MNDCFASDERNSSSLTWNGGKKVTLELPYLKYRLCMDDQVFAIKEKDTCF